MYSEKPSSNSECPSPVFPGAWPRDTALAQSRNLSYTSLDTECFTLEPTIATSGFSEDVANALRRISCEQDLLASNNLAKMTNTHLPALGGPFESDKTLVNCTPCYQQELAMETIEEGASDTRIYEEISASRNSNKIATTLLPEIPPYPGADKELNKETASAGVLDDLNTKLQEVFNRRNILKIESLDLSSSPDLRRGSPLQTEMQRSDKYNSVVSRSSFDSKLDLLTLDAPSFTLSLPGSPDTMKAINNARTQEQGTVDGDYCSPRSLHLSASGEQNTLQPQLSSHCLSTPLTSLERLGRHIKGLVVQLRRPRQRLTLGYPEYPKPESVDMAEIEIPGTAAARDAPPTGMGFKGRENNEILTVLRTPMKAIRKFLPHSSLKK